ncbi:MAG: tetratricopeptide repeat protein, partial [Gammaproteobacteria bacterium]|nr:tetratricopeptide repeat protein [Gammaproteobacteria bacterium]
ELNQLDSLTVISRTSAARFKNSELSVPEIADSLGVDAVIEGDVFRDGDSVRISASLIRAHPERQLWTGTYTRSLRNLMSLHAEVTRAVAQEIEIALTPQVEARLAGAQEADPEAYELYLRGHVLLGEYTEEAFWKAKEYFEAAIARDSSYAVAYVGLASTYSQLGFYGAVPPREAESRMRAYAARALSLDEDLADARAVMASSLKETWDWSGAERELRQAIALEANSEFARREYSSLLRALGRHEEALQQAEMALRINPLSPLANIEAGFVYWDAERYDEAVQLVQKSLDLDSMHVNAHYTLGLAYGQLGRFDDAVTAMQRSVALSGGSPVRLSGLGWAYAVAGRPDSAAAILERLEQLLDSVDVSPMLPAFIHTALGNHDRALELLERAYRERSPFMRYLKVEPRLKPLRGDARFQTLLRQMGLTS